VDKDKSQDKPANNMSTQTVCPGPALPTSSKSPARFRFGEFITCLITVQAKEAKELRQKDPKLWTVNSLSRLFKVKPSAIV
jgi:hypothetical protein